MSTIPSTASSVTPTIENITKNQPAIQVADKIPTIDTIEKLSLDGVSKNEENSVSDTLTNFQKIKNQIVNTAEFVAKKVGEKAVVAIDVIGGGVGFVVNRVVTSSLDVCEKVGDFLDKIKGKENSPGSVDDIKDPDTIIRLKENPDYVKILDVRHANANPDVKAIYDKYEKHIKISNILAFQAAAYYPASREITLCASEDSKDHPKAGHLYFHEVGHFIDDKMTIGIGYASSNKKFNNLLRTDFDNYINNYMKENNIVEREDAYMAVGKMMSGQDCDEYRNVSDIFGGLSENMAGGRWGHSNDYWKGTRYAVNNEAFANMFEASMNGNENTLKYMKEMLPTAYEAFLTMIKNHI